jgi:outer membrane protein OmpA-like peptidoglycan-associated protein
MRMFRRGRALVLSVLILAGLSAWSQQKPASSVYTDIGITFAVERAELVPGQCCFWLKGGGADVAVTFWKGLGIAATVTGDHASNYVPGIDINKISFLGGPRYTYTVWNTSAAAQGRPRMQVYGQGLFGGTHAFDGGFPSGTGLVSTASSFALQAGGGFNYFFSKSLGLRLIEADYVRTELPNGSSDTQNDLRLAFGIDYHLGKYAPPLGVALACSASPSTVFPGDPVSLTATASNLNPKLNTVYSWSGTGVTGSGASASVATATLAPGSYTANCAVKEGKPGKEGLKPWESAQGTASFTVKAFEPPTISCSANPATINPGETANITAVGVSPQNRPLTYSYAAAAGSVSGSGASAVYSSTGAPTGATAITCTVTDDKSQTVSASATVTITAPYVAPVPHAQALCSIAFEKDSKRPARVDNEAKACLDEIALDLNRQADAKVVLVGDSTAAEKAPKKTKRHAKAAPTVDLGAQRAVNAKDYLVTEKGIDASRVSVATGANDGQKVEDYLVPAGANFAADVSGTTPVDETAVKPAPRKPLAAKPAHHKKTT